MPYLDENGLAHLWGKIDATVAAKQNKLTAKNIMTQEEFDALPEEKQNTGLYIISDGEGSGASNSGIPAGGIIIWSGASNAVPAGWALCDGTNGTPDLRDRFVLGAGIVHTTGETGGDETVTLTVRQMPKHDHMLREATAGDTTVLAGGYRQLAKGTLVRTAQAPAEIWNEDMDLPDYYPKMPYMEDTGWSEPHPNMPPYYTLAYIMKL